MRISNLYFHPAALRCAPVRRRLPGNVLPATATPPGLPDPANQQGFANLEFLIVALPLLMTAAGIFEASRWHMTREIVSVALLQAARAGSTNHAHPLAIQQAFEAALAPLYAPAGRYANPQARMRQRIRRFEDRSGQPAWQITIAHPNALEFQDFRQDDLPIAQRTGLPAINNNYQYEQDLQLGTGQASGATIYAANTLQLNAVYHYEPVVPGLSLLLRTLFGSGKPASTPGLGLGVLPIRSSISIEMQSHPVFWQSSANTHVTYAAKGSAPIAAPGNHQPLPDAALKPGKPSGGAVADPSELGGRDHAATSPLRDPANPAQETPPANTSSGESPGEQAQDSPVPGSAQPEDALAPTADCAT